MFVLTRQRHCRGYRAVRRGRGVLGFVGGTGGLRAGDVPERARSRIVHDVSRRVNQRDDIWALRMGVRALVEMAPCPYRDRLCSSQCLPALLSHLAERGTPCRGGRTSL